MHTQGKTLQRAGLSSWGLGPMCSAFTGDCSGKGDSAPEQSPPLAAIVGCGGSYPHQSILYTHMNEGMYAYTYVRRGR